MVSISSLNGKNKNNSDSRGNFILIKIYPNVQLGYSLLIYITVLPRAHPRRAKGAEAPPLAKLKLRKKIKYRIVLFFFVSRVIWPMVLKIDYDTAKLQKVTYDVKMITSP